MAVTILELPTEVLHEIFSCFRRPCLIDAGPGQFDWNWADRDSRPADLQAIKCSRLACRRFNEGASRFLLPCISVCVDQKSLDLVERIVRNPLVVSGVRAMRVDLSCYPWKACADLQSFTERQTREIQNEEYYISHGERHMHYADCQLVHWDCQMHDDYDLHTLIQGDISSILASWNDDPAPKANSTGSATADKSPNYRGALLDVYNKFHAGYAEQARPLGSGLFARSLASLVSRLSRFGALCLHGGSKSLRENHDPLMTFSDPELLVGFLSTPYSWYAAENSRPSETMEVATTSILRDLPIAIHESGRTIRALRIMCFPASPRNVSFIDLSGREERFRAALQDLEYFKLFSPRCHRRHENEVLVPDGLDGASGRYLAAAVSASSLRKIDVLRRHYQGHRLYAASTVLAAVTSEHITELLLQEVTVSEYDLVNIFSRLGNRPTRVRLDVLRLSEGNWAPVANILPRKTAARCADGTCCVEVKRSWGLKYP